MSATPDGLPPLREVVAAHGLAPKKALGQNFLFDLNLTRRIARASGPLEGQTVVEVGPGPGGLTRALFLEGAAHVIVIERDPRCRPALDAIGAVYPGRLAILDENALEVDLAALAALAPGGKFRICSNLPYNVGTALLVKWLEAEPWPPAFERLTLMFQREVAERIVATPKTRAEYGRLGVLCGWRTEARILFDVPPSAFTPPPSVMSSVVELTPRENPLPCQGALLTAIAQSAFGQRRKMLRQSLKSFSSAKSLDVAKLIDAAGLAPTARAEEIDVAGFVALAREAAAMGSVP